jgi:hypothetical protein
VKGCSVINIGFKDDLSILKMGREWDAHGAKFRQKRLSVYLDIEINFVNNCENGHNVIIFE